MLGVAAYLILSFSITNLLLGLIVLIRTKRELVNIAFLVYAFVASVWTFNNFYLRVNPDIFFLRTAYGIGIIVATTALFWVLIFLYGRLSKKAILAYVPLTLLTAGVTVFSDKVVEVLYSIELFGYEGRLGPYFDFYSGYITIIIIVIIYHLLHNLRHVNDLDKKRQIVFVFSGISFFAVVSLIVSFIIPTFLNTFRYTILDNMSFSVALVMIAYAILKHQLFDIKVIATEILTFVLWAALFGRVLFSIGDTQDLLINIALLVFTVILGLSLIKSVVKEVEAREALATANRKLTRLNLEKSEFLSIATHQLKAPLAVIRGYASMLNEGSYGAVGDKAKEVLGRIYDSATNLVVVIDDYLNVSRIDQGRMQYQFGPTDMIHLVNSIALDMKQTAAHAKIDLSAEIVPDDDYSAVADVGKVRQVITNIIDNAIKYTNEGGWVKIRLFKPDAGHLRITISDNGIGMSEETTRKLFRRFSRARDIGKTERAGTGLGLYIAKEMVRAHSGRIWAESEGEGRGSTFCIELPLKPIQEEGTVEHNTFRGEETGTDKP